MNHKYRTFYFHFNLIVLIIIGYSKAVFSQTDTIKMEQVEITSSRIPSVYSESSRIVNIITKEQIENAAVNDILDLLKLAVGVDCRQRGVNGVQSDISIRGGTYEQVLILLNGIPLNDPQTGHHTLNLPVDIHSIQRIEVLEGPGCRIYGPNAFSGAINIITENELDKNLVLAIHGGAHKLIGGFVGYTQQIGKVQNYISFSKKQSDGFMPNTDFDINQFFYQSAMNINKAKIDFQAGYIDKAFGANSFYSSKYPNQFEYTKTGFLGLKLATKGKVDAVYNIYWRRNQDLFELFRENPPVWYHNHNYHLTNSMGANANYSFKTKLGKTAFGGELRHEAILSNVLGEDLIDSIPVPGQANVFFKKGKQRQNASFFIEHSYTFYQLTTSAGMLLNWNSDYDWKAYPGIDMSYLLNKKIKLIASINESMRIPSFTDLYYASATNIGNPNLKPETSLSYEIGTKYLVNAFDVHLVAFRREGKNLIDWVKYPDSTKWESRNITKVNTNGVELGVNVNCLKLTNNKHFFIDYFSINYNYLNATKIKNDYLSKYALDYLKHKVDFSIKHKIYKSIYAVWSASYQDRNSTYIDYTTQQETKYQPIYLVNSKIVWKYRFLESYIEASNLLNNSYYDYGNIIMPGRWISAGIKADLNL